MDRELIRHLAESAGIPVSTSWNDPCPSILDLIQFIANVDAERGKSATAYLTYKGDLLHADDPKVLEHSDPSPLFLSPVAPTGMALVPKTVKGRPPDNVMAVHAEWVNNYASYADFYEAAIAAAQEA